MRIVPAIDLIGSRCVRLRKGAFDTVQTVGESPVKQAREFAARGYRRLHLVDLDGARARKPIEAHVELLREIYAETGLEIDYSGGLSDEGNVERILSAGASQVVIGSLAVNDSACFEAVLQTFGPERIILAADCKEGFVTTHAWQVENALSIENLIGNFRRIGGTRVMVTDVLRDGLLEGSNVELYATLRKNFPDMQFIASGGVSGDEDILKLSKIGINEIIVGKALYAGLLTDKVKHCIW